jgi:ketosteroid isomerase-like protein
MTRFKSWFVVIAVLVLLYLSTTSGEAQAPINTEQQQIVDVVSRFFKAAEADSHASLGSTVTPDFYVFDNGMRFDSSGVMGLIKEMHGKGVLFQWNVTQPDVHIFGDTAWIAYVNRGSVTKDSITNDEQWLESAFLRRDAGTWKIVFLHSTHVAKSARR